MHNQWQDIVLAISMLIFNIALIPSITGKSKPALTTSLLTTVFNLANVAVYISLSLWYTTIMGTINALLWGILTVQQFQKSQAKKRKK